MNETKLVLSKYTHPLQQCVSVVLSDESHFLTKAKIALQQQTLGLITFRSPMTRFISNTPADQMSISIVASHERLNIEKINVVDCVLSFWSKDLINTSGGRKPGVPLRGGVGLQVFFNKTSLREHRWKQTTRAHCQYYFAILCPSNTPNLEPTLMGLCPVCQKFLSLHKLFLQIQNL